MAIISNVQELTQHLAIISDVQPLQPFSQSPKALSWDSKHHKLNFCFFANVVFYLPQKFTNQVGKTKSQGSLGLLIVVSSTLVSLPTFSRHKLILGFFVNI
jgi:hypothetical protein